jgi:Tfp pilus assembly protein PilN
LIIRSCLIVWTGIGAIVAGGLLTVGWQQHARLAAAQTALQQAEAECLPVRAMQEENDRMSRRIAELHGRQTLLAQLKRGRDPLQLVGLVSRSAMFVEGELKVAALSYQISRPSAVEQPNRAGDAATVTPPPPETIRLTLDGIAMNDMAVSKFIVALRDSGCFTSVELRSSIRATLATGNARKFLVECRL